MRIDLLDLQAIGPFAQKTLDFSPPEGTPVDGSGAGGLHFIYGPNEAGKSTILRALRYAFFGFPVQLRQDTQKFAFDQLRVGAKLTNGLSQTLDFVRRKGNKSTLRERGNETQTLPDDALAPYMGSVTEPLFSMFFGLTHDALVAGGREILAGQGDVGQILFSGTGLGDVQRLQRELEEERDRLFKEGGKNPAINTQLARLKELREKLKECQLAARDWEQLQESLQEAVTQRQAAEQKLAQATQESARLRRLKDALQPLADQAASREALRSLQDVVHLPADFPARRQSAQMELTRNEANRDQIARQLASLKNELAALPADHPVMSCGESIEDLQDRRGAVNKAERDVVLLREQWQDLQTQLKRLRRELGGDEAAELPKISTATRRTLETLRAEYRELALKQTANRQALAPKQREWAVGQDRLDRLPDGLDASPLEHLVEEAVPLRGHPDQLQKLDRQLAELGEELDLKLKRLPGWEGAAEALETLPAPSVEAVERFRDEADRLRQRRETLARQLETARAALRDCADQQAELRGQREVPTEAVVVEARRQRDLLWAELSRLCLDPAADRALLAAQVLPFERAVRAADDVCDLLRRDAERSARFASLQLDQARHERAVAELSAQAAAADAEWADWEGRWAALWQPLSLAPQPPREMQAWLRQHAEILTLRGDQRRLRIERDALQKTLADATARLAAALSLTPPTTLDAALRTAQKELAAQREQDEERRQLQRDLARLQGELAELEATAASLQQQQAGWQARWAEATAGLPWATDGSLDQLTPFLEHVAEIEKLQPQADQLLGRIKGIEADSAQFKADVARCLERTDPDLAQLPPDEAVGRMAARLKVATQNDEHRAVLEGQIRKLADELSQREAAIGEQRACLTQLCKEARVGSIDELPQAEEASRQRQRHEERLEQAEARLRQLAGRDTIEQLAEQARGYEPDELASRLSTLTAEVQTLQTQLGNDLGPRIGRLETQLATMKGDSKAAEINEEIRDLTSRLSADAEEFARLQLAWSLLTEGIKDYRERHQAPILERAGRLFARLTREVFAGLTTDFDEDGSPVLLAVRAGGERIPVQAMSDGTADQLYLAIRLAWVEDYLASHEPFPLIVDDLLIQFDDERSLATLEVLADVARRTQILFFTHHERLVDLAEADLPADAFRVHRLERTALRADQLPEEPVPVEPSPKPTKRGKAKAAALTPPTDETTPIEAPSPEATAPAEPPNGSVEPTNGTTPSEAPTAEAAPSSDTSNPAKLPRATKQRSLELDAG